MRLHSSRTGVGYTDKLQTCAHDLEFACRFLVLMHLVLSHKNSLWHLRLLTWGFRDRQAYVVIPPSAHAKIARGT